MVESQLHAVHNSASHIPDRGMFVGRQKEMDELRAALNDALECRGRMMMLVGQPGIGKTRTAQEMAEYAVTQGVQVLWGWCYETEGAPPYWPWVQPLRSYIQQGDPQRLSSDMRLGAADIAEIIPKSGRNCLDWRSLRPWNRSKPIPVVRLHYQLPEEYRPISTPGNCAGGFILG